VLVRINEQDVKTVSAYENALENTAVNDTIAVTVLRQGGQDYTELTFTVTVGVR
jgi:S1-C subfamily serine protease